MSKRDLVSILDLKKQEITEIFKMAKELKENPYSKILEGKTLAMIFHKPSTRTRVSFEAGMTQLGGHAIYLNSQDLQLKRGETISDTGRTLSRYVDIIMIRTYSHDDVIELANSTSIPVINGLTDLLHPCQVLSDIFTVLEKKAGDFENFNYSNLNITFIGDGNNVCNSFINAQKVLNFNLTISTPENYKPSLLKENKNVRWTHSPEEAVKNADVIYTDVWASMGKEEEQEERKKIFLPYQVNSNLLKKAKEDVFVMHCLPAHRGQEITDEVIDGKNSIVFDQAENRLHVQKAIIRFLLNK